MSNEINEIGAALAKVQGSIEHASKDSANPFFKSSYADLASVWGACRTQLADNGISVVQLPDGLEDNCLILETTMLHTSGQWISSRMKMPLAKSDPQGFGSALTYARRYALAAIVGVYQDDDDANLGSGKTTTKVNVPTTTVKPATAQATKPITKVTESQRKQLVALATEKALSGEDMRNIIKFKYHKDSSAELTELQAKYLTENLQSLWESFIESQAS